MIGDSGKELAVVVGLRSAVVLETEVEMGGGGRRRSRSLRDVPERRRESRVPHPAPALVLRRLLPHGSHMKRRGELGMIVEFGFVSCLIRERRGEKGSWEVES